MSFLAPWALLGLLSLPALWFILRAVPPRPASIFFPPLRILEQLDPTEQTPDKTPWWLLAMRLLLVGLLVLAFAGPQWRNQADPQLPGSEGTPLLVVLETGWAAAPDWDRKITQAERILGAAQRAGRPMSVIGLPSPLFDAPSPADIDAARAALDQLEPLSVPTDRNAVSDLLLPVLSTQAWADAGIVWFTDGIQAPVNLPDELAQRTMFVHGEAPKLALVLDVAADGPAVTLQQVSEPDFADDNQFGLAGADIFVSAYDELGRELSRTSAIDSDGSLKERVAFDLPLEVRNDIARIALLPTQHAGHVVLVDDRLERRLVWVVGGDQANQAQPLLSPSTYVQRALAENADIVAASSGDDNSDLQAAIDAGAHVIVLASASNLLPSTSAVVEAWIERGGVFVRFAGPGIENTVDSLFPVRLRQSNRQLGGSLTWEQPQAIAPFASGSPFFGFEVPEDVAINRQVLSEPGSAIRASTYASLTDGTPLVSGAARERGHLIFFHVTADPSWSNLPISGLFVDMLQRITELAAVNPTNNSPASLAIGAVALEPNRIVNGFGQLSSAPASVESIVLDGSSAVVPSPATPPGFYGPNDGQFALNLFSEAPELEAIANDDTIGTVASTVDVPTGEALNLTAALLTAAVLLAILDSVVAITLSGGAWIGAARRTMTASLALFVALSLSSDPTLAQSDGTATAALEKAIAAANTTRFGYVLTGDATLDQRSQEGIAGLSRVLTQRTAFEPAEPFAVDPMVDELAVYPMLYWPLPDVPMAISDNLISRVDAYMNNGGTILFDTRDEATAIFSGPVSVPTQNLRALLGQLNVPPLEPAADEHVLTKSFYLIDSFPGRFAGGALWVEALPDADESDSRPARGGDGVSSLIITSNDLASAWALSPTGTPLYATSPPDPVQREFSYRAGVNIAMYVLTGNYKADQVHIPALLQRLVR
ncbi:MAG: DUF4159 domain-containing protein [Pseudomonadota bacterium]